jgi:hypothetical protein
MSVEKLNDRAWTPATVIADLEAEKIEHLVVVAKFKDGTIDTIGSFMQLPDLALLCKVFERRVLRELDRSAEHG